jgi:outer membrane protein assembly factor BamB
MSKPSSAQKAPTATPNKRTSRSPDAAFDHRRSSGGSYIPNHAFWVVVLLSVIGVTLTQRLSDDPSLSHIVMFISAVVCGFSLLTWFRFFSVYDLRTRRNVMRVVFCGGMMTMIGLAMLRNTNRVRLRFSGSLIPQLVTKSALDANVGGGTADLATTTSIDFPQFLGPQRNSVIAGANLSRDWKSNPPTLLWKNEMGAGWSAFAAVNGFAVTIEQRGAEEELEVVTCYEIETGAAVWSSEFPVRHTTVMGFVGPRSTPTIHGGRVYTMGATGVVRCLDGNDGTEIWRRDLMAERQVTQEEAENGVTWGRAGSPLVVDDRLIVNVGGAGQDIVTLAALDLKNGRTLWESGSHQIAYASPVLATLHGKRQILSVNENYVTAHDVETGDILWEHPWKGLSNMNANCSQPVAVDDARVFLSKGYGRGAELIETSPGDDPASEWSTRTLWTNKVMKTKFSNVAIRDGFVYGLDDGILSCIELDTGRRRWKKGRYGYGQILMVDDLLLVMSELRGEVALVEANPDQYVKLGEFNVIEGQTWNNLCLYGDRLLVRNSDEAACIQLPTDDVERDSIATSR